MDLDSLQLQVKSTPEGFAISYRRQHPIGRILAEWSEDDWCEVLRTQALAVIAEHARQLRNADDYDDWAYGTEPIPGEPWRREGRNPPPPAAR
ncbi:hypothetical protein [Vulcanococcus sp.]|uniref:hypothetical protein n=1 Tax=Vulcanococcus sp. TaxID=2856995 RepID=UPI003C12ACBD